MIRMPLTRRRVTAVTALAAVTFMGTAAVAAAPLVDLDFAQLDKGAAPAVPYVSGRTLVDGDTRITLPRNGTYLGAAGADHIVLTSTDQGSVDIRRVTPTGTQTVIATGDDLYQADLSEDGAHLLRQRAGRNRTRVVVLDTATGAEVARKRFAIPYASVETAAGDRVLLTAWGSEVVGTWEWTISTDAVRRVSKLPAYWANLTQDRMAVFTKDVYDGGCSRLVPVSAPKQTIWKSCTDAIVTMSPNGRRVATMHLMADGLGPGRISVHNAKGRLKASYDAPLVFGTVRWESDKALLLETIGRKKQALVRCVGTTCDRATPFTKSTVYRQPLRLPFSRP